MTVAMNKGAYTLRVPKADYAKRRSSDRHDLTISTASFRLSSPQPRNLAVIATTAFFVFWLWRSTPASDRFLSLDLASHTAQEVPPAVSNTSETASTPFFNRQLAHEVDHAHARHLQQHLHHSTQQSEWELQVEPQDMDVTGPAYEIRVLRSTLQHSDHMYQDTTGEAHGPLIQTLLHLHVVAGLRPLKTDESITASCAFTNPEQPRDIWRQTASIHTYAPHPLDQDVGHSFAISVECEVPTQLHSTAADIQNLTIDVSFDAGRLKTDTFEGEDHDVRVTATKRGIPVTVTPPMQIHSEIAICAPPLDFRLTEERLWRLLEWRQHMLNVGIERVNWYLRDETFRNVLKAYKRMKGTKDVLRHAPNLIPSRSGQHLDQTVWYLECMQNNVHSSDWILIADTDEFLIPDYEAMEPSKQLGEFLGAQEEHIGDIVLDRIEMIKPQADKSADSNIELYQSEFTCAHSGRSMFKSVAEGRHHVKTLYRSHAVARFNQHRHIEMFPLPPATASKQGLNQGHLWQSFDQASYTDGVWPKLVHYRTWGSGMDTCDLPSPMADQPRYRMYLQDLRRNVSAMVDGLTNTYATG